MGKPEDSIKKHTKVVQKSPISPFWLRKISLFPPTREAIEAGVLMPLYSHSRIHHFRRSHLRSPLSIFRSISVERVLQKGETDGMSRRVPHRVVMGVDCMLQR